MALSTDTQVDSGLPGWFVDNARGLVDSGRHTWASLADHLESADPAGSVAEVAWCRAQVEVAEPVPAKAGKGK